MLASPDNKYVQGFKFIGYRTNSTEEITLVEAVGLDQAGEWQIYDLKPGEQVVGVYGSINSANNIRGLGFLVWEPLDL